MTYKVGDFVHRSRKYANISPFQLGVIVSKNDSTLFVEWLNGTCLTLTYAAEDLRPAAKAAIERHLMGLLVE